MYVDKRLAGISGADVYRAESDAPLKETHLFWIS